VAVVIAGAIDARIAGTAVQPTRLPLQLMNPLDRLCRRSRRHHRRLSRHHRIRGVIRFVLEAVARRRDLELELHRLRTPGLLHGVRDFVSEQVLSARRRRIVVAGAEVNVVAYRVGLRADRVGGVRRGAAGVDTNAGQIGTKEVSNWRISVLGNGDPLDDDAAATACSAPSVTPFASRAFRCTRPDAIGCSGLRSSALRLDWPGSIASLWTTAAAGALARLCSCSWFMAVSYAIAPVVDSLPSSVNSRATARSR